MPGISFSDLLKALGIVVTLGGGAIAAYVTIKMDVADLKASFVSVRETQMSMQQSQAITSIKVDRLYDALIEGKPE